MYTCIDIIFVNLKNSNKYDFIFIEDLLYMCYDFVKKKI